MPKIRDWDALWSEEAVEVGLIIFPGKVCSGCGLRLPANRDYFQPDKTRGGDGMRERCRRCRSERDKGRYDNPDARAARRTRERARYATDPEYAERRRESARRTAARKRQAVAS